MLELNLGIIGIFFSMLFSGTEIALISANKLQLELDKNISELLK